MLDGAKPAKEEFFVVRLGGVIQVKERPEVKKGSFCDRQGLSLGSKVKVKFKLGRSVLLRSRRPGQGHPDEKFRTLPGVVVKISAKGRWAGVVLLGDHRGHWISLYSTSVDSRWDSARLVEVDGRKVVPEKRPLGKVPIR